MTCNTVPAEHPGNVRSKATCLIVVCASGRLWSNQWVAHLCSGPPPHDHWGQLQIETETNGQTVSHKHTNAYCSKSNHHISVIPIVCVFYCYGTNYCKLSVLRYEFIFSQFLCIRDWSLADLCLLFGIPIASTHVSLGCFPFWTWPCLVMQL